MKIYGDYHIHSEFSGDAKGTIDEIAKMAKERGLSEIAITDHGPRCARGCKTKQYKHVRAMIDKANREVGINVFFGVEANVISTCGKIDVDQVHRRDLDIILCDFHKAVRVANIRSFFFFLIPNNFWHLIRWFPKGRIRRNTEIMKRVIELNDIDIWTHPNRSFRVNVVEVAKTCASVGTLVELNGKRINFRPIDFERMKAAGVKFVINSDAHNPKEVGRTDRVSEFLKNVDWEDSDFVNLTGPFRRGEANILEQIQARHDEAEMMKPEEKSKAQLKQEQKETKKKLKQDKKREKVIKSKSE